MTVPRFKAGQGLDKIPSDKEEWHEAIIKYGLQRRTLEQLCLERRFSASTVPKEAFLTMRCIWPKKKHPAYASTYIANLEYFFNEDNSDDARKLMNENALGLDKLRALYRIVCSPKEPRKVTPPEYINPSFHQRTSTARSSPKNCILRRSANSFETTYTFGPVRNTSQQQDDVRFRARIDGSIPFGVSLAMMPREAVIFEAKRAPRGNNEDSIPVLTQQSMEHVAYIWRRHEKDSTWEKSVNIYHTFMVAQDHLYFHISIGTYDSTYLKYIFGSGTQSVVPGQGENSFLEIQEFGLFKVGDEEAIDAFLHIMLSLILWQLEQTNAGSTFKAALS
ncbi:hypothetical protein FQN54_007226 [Arachnomyces sp. PD_36]|nr:hypothetical protein FQN54_007226 [Arachnomyces sp. PD_36]